MPSRAPRNVSGLVSWSGANPVSPPSNNDYTAVYVGSHNFSKTAWGLGQSAPSNVEFGVVLLTTRQEQATEWKSRLPYQLPPSPKHKKKHGKAYEPGRRFDIMEACGQLGNNDDDGYMTSGAEDNDME